VLASIAMLQWICFQALSVTGLGRSPLVPCLHSAIEAAQPRLPGHSSWSSLPRLASCQRARLFYPAKSELISSLSRRPPLAPRRFAGAPQACHQVPLRSFDFLLADSLESADSTLKCNA
jgi:hypothetical protein